MKRIAIVVPYFPPSGLTCVHRARFLASYLKDFGWEPVIITVDPNFYKENADTELLKFLPADLKIIRTKALGKSFFIGDISIRCFYWHWQKLRRLAKNKEIDFVFISLFPAYSTLLGRLIYREFKIPYAIDYQDPWVMYHKRKDPLFSKAWFSTGLARILEPVAVRKASLLVSVADSYLRGVISRNSCLRDVPRLIVPIGFDAADFLAADKSGKAAYLFKPRNNDFRFVYAGAMLPQGFVVLEAFLKSLVRLRESGNQTFKRIKVYFIGTGKSSNDKEGYNVRPMAEKYGLYGSTIYECPQRISYSDVLVHLKASDAILVLGSTEEHYSPSKIFPAVFSGKPILAILHEKSPVLGLLRESNVGRSLSFSTDTELSSLIPQTATALEAMATLLFDKDKVNYSIFNEFSAKAGAGKLAAALDKIVLDK